MSNYKREPIRPRRREQIAEDFEFLEEAMAGAPLGDPTDEEVTQIVTAQRRIRKKLRGARRS